MKNIKKQHDDLVKIIKKLSLNIDKDNNFLFLLGNLFGSLNKDFIKNINEKELDYFKNKSATDFYLSREFLLVMKKVDYHLLEHSIMYIEASFKALYALEGELSKTTLFEKVIMPQPEIFSKNLINIYSTLEKTYLKQVVSNNSKKNIIKKI